MTRPLHRLAPLALASLLLAGAAPAQERVQDRLARIERLLDSGALTDLANRQDQLRQSVQELRGEVELLRRELDETRQRQRDLYVDVDRRLRQLETAAPLSTEPPAVQDSAAHLNTPSEEPTTTADEPPLVVTGGDELSDYQAAFALLKAGRYAQSAAAFEAFLERYPKGRYAANALYWLGESYYVVRDFGRALPYFQRVVEEHPGDGKQPDAMLKIGFIHFEQGEMEQARSILEKVRDGYPTSSAAALAEQRLARIR